MDWNRMNPFKANDTSQAQQGQPNNNQQQRSPITPGNQPNGQQVDPNDTMNRIQDPQNRQNVNADDTGDDNGRQGNGEQDVFKGLWENEVKVGADGKPIAEGPTSFLPQLSPEKQSEIFSKLNFTSGIDKKHLAAIKAGGDDAEQALLEVLNAQGRSVATTLFKGISSMTESAFAGAEKRFLDKVPGSVNGIISANNLAKHPIMSKSEYAPMVEMVRSQIQTKNARATPEVIESLVSKYFDNMTKGFTDQTNSQNQQQQNQNSKKQTGTDDFEQWFQDAA